MQKLLSSGRDACGQFILTLRYFYDLQLPRHQWIKTTPYEWMDNFLTASSSYYVIFMLYLVPFESKVINNQSRSESHWRSWSFNFSAILALKAVKERFPTVLQRLTEERKVKQFRQIFYLFIFRLTCIVGRQIFGVLWINWCIVNCMSKIPFFWKAKKMFITFH